MAAPMDVFAFPISIDLQKLPNKDSKVCVISVVGKSQLNTFTSKASKLNPILEKDVFKGIPLLGDVSEDFMDQGDVECYYDNSGQVIYLHYRCLHDVQRLAVLSQRLSQEEYNKDFFNLWQKEEYKYIRTLLWMFSVSHIILLSHPGSSFDISYVRLFRTLDTIRLKLQHCFTEQLQGLPVSKDWYHNGRPCSPRVLFVFELSTLEVTTEDQDSGTISKKQTPAKKVQHAIEDQIYRILRKSRVITNISNNSLFAVPANQEFVFVHRKRQEVLDPVYMYLQQLKNNSMFDRDTDSPRSRSYQTNRRTSQSTEESKPPPGTPRAAFVNTLKDFLREHIDLALGRGFDDNVGRNPVQAIFESPTCQNWFTVASKMYSFFFGENINSKAQAHFNTLKSLLETDIRFSENRCNKVLPLAEAAYQEGLPTHYVTNYHLNKLSQAQRVFYQFARGPACEKYIKQLEGACEKYWKNGHQLCEEISLTGNHCVNPLHRLPDEAEVEENSHLPVMSHASQAKTKAACNCGRKQADKDDPFDHKAANFDFYDALEKTCCEKLEHIAIPVFQPSTTEVRAGQLLAPSQSSTGNKDTLKQDTVSGSLSLALSLGQSGGGEGDYFTHPSTEGGVSLTTDTEHHPEHIDIEDHEERGEMSNEHPPNQQPTDLSPEPATTDTPAITHDLISEQSALRQHSTIEYLPGMLHSDSPLGLLPKYSSWALCCLGRHTLYSHTQGLELPGFLHGSNYLLPWDITVKVEKDKWPSVGETASRKGKQKKVTKEIGEVNVRVFLGDEYECPRGHRFFCSGPEKIIKVSNTSTVKDNANKLVNLDMPLYCACPHCRSSKGYMAQLMRLYIVTPEGPMRVTLNPQIQPAPHPCPTFSLGFIEGAVEIPPGGLWVLRLPSVYLGDHGPYMMPSDVQQVQACRMLKGVFQYKETVAET